MSHVSLHSLHDAAGALRRQPRTADTPLKLEQLRSQAVQIGVGVAFDQQLRVLFADVYGNRPMPPPSLISAGAPLLSSFGGAKGAALQFHMLHAQQQPMAGFSTTTPSPMPKERQFATAPGAPIIVGA